MIHTIFGSDDGALEQTPNRRRRLMRWRDQWEAFKRARRVQLLESAHVQIQQATSASNNTNFIFNAILAPDSGRQRSDALSRRSTRPTTIKASWRIDANLACPAIPSKRPSPSIKVCRKRHLPSTSLHRKLRRFDSRKQNDISP